MGEWRPIDTAPKDGAFQICIRGMESISWPAYSIDGRIYSRAHGLVNEMNRYGETLIATHWMPSPEPPK